MGSSTKLSEMRDKCHKHNECAGVVKNGNNYVMKKKKFGEVKSSNYKGERITSKEECQLAAEMNNKQYSQINNSSYPSGCFKIGNQYRYNSNASQKGVFNKLPMCGAR